MAPREAENNAYAKFGVINKEYYGMIWYFLEWSINWSTVELKKVYLVSKIKERELGKHVFQDFLKNNYLQGKKQANLTYNDHQLWTKHERERDQKSVHCYMYISMQYLLASDLLEFHISQ